MFLGKLDRHISSLKLTAKVCATLSLFNLLVTRFVCFEVATLPPHRHQACRVGFGFGFWLQPQNCIWVVPRKINFSVMSVMAIKSLVWHDVNDDIKFQHFAIFGCKTCMKKKDNHKTSHIIIHIMHTLHIYLCNCPYPRRPGKPFSPY